MAGVQRRLKLDVGGNIIENAAGNAGVAGVQRATASEQTRGRVEDENKLGDDHTLTMTMAIPTTMTTAMMMATTTTKKLHQDFSKIILCDFRVSFVSQINWQPIGKLLFMINLGQQLIQ